MGMSKKKKVTIISGVFGLMLLGGTAWFFVPSTHQEQPSQDIVNIQSNSSNVLSDTSDPNSISLNRPRSTTSSGGLSVTNGGSANNLGQLTPENTTSNNSSPKSKSQSNPFDPSAFTQYDKYVNEQNALFGDVQAGTGAELTTGKKAAVYYKGWLTNGQLFDMSRTGENGQLEPFVFEMGAHGVIPGWEEALYGMKAGGVRLVIVPPAAGYGASGQGPIPGDAVLIFQVQLLDVQ
jgi:FKBP-type peptidyl-prolyl cis-trans isomerase FkpA